MKIALERSANQIYDRIVLELAHGFIVSGHECSLIQPSEISNYNELLTAYNQHDIALITNSTGLLSLRREHDFLFEAIQPKLVFLHHDAPFSSPDLEVIREKICAFIRVRDRSIHLTIEKSDEDDLRRLGIPSYSTAHICTLGSAARPKTKPEYVRDVAFLGHIIPPTDVHINFGTQEDLDFFESYRARTIDLQHNIKADYERLHRIEHASDILDFISKKAQYLQYVNFYTMFHRGRLLQSLNARDIHIFGGDPAWLHGKEQTRLLTGANMHYHAPVFDPMQVAQIFVTTRVNLNITSLQFDTALINRVADCALAGGFILTDKKSQLNELTSVAEEVSFANPEEMASKIAFHTNPDNATKTLEIAQQLGTDLIKNCSISATVENIIARAKGNQIKSSQTAPYE